MWSRHSLRRRSLPLFRGSNREQNRSKRARQRPCLELLEERQLLSGNYSFDFGPPSGTPVPGYTLTGATPYSSSVGYGWQVTSPIYATSAKWKNYNPLLYDADMGWSGTFLVNVPNGNYNVTPTLGNEFSAMNEVSLSLDGNQVASNMATAAGQFASPTYQASVTNGQLSLELYDSGGGIPFWWIDALTISPSSQSLTLAANAGPAITANEGSTVSFSGATVTGGTAPLSYLWNFGDGTPEADVLNPSHVYQLNGSYTASLTVTDATGLSSESGTAVTINQVAPVVSLQAPSAGTAGSPLSFIASATDTNPLDQAGGYTYAWTFGDGATGTGADPSHTYNAAGTYTVSVTATAVHDKATSKAATATLEITAASGPINITSAWLAQQGSAPYYLTQSGATYVLQTNVSTPGTAFIALASNITFNLNGYTVTYDTAQPVAVTNGGFEQGSSPTNIPGWNVSNAPGAIRVPALTGMWGNWALELPNISSTESITSSPITIPQANIEYAAIITPKDFVNEPTVTLSVVDTVTGAVLASQASPDPDEGFSPVVKFTPTTTDPVQLVVTIAPPSGHTTTLYLDDASVARMGSYGVVATPSPWLLPPQLQTPIVAYDAPSVANFTVENGSIAQGGGDSYSASAVFAMSIPGVTINAISATASGDDTNILNLIDSSNPVVTNSQVIGQLTRISDRMSLYAGIQFSNATGAILAENNTITGTMDTGIFVDRIGTVTAPVTISGNTIAQNTLVTDGYGIYLNNVENFVVANNTVDPVNGRGMMLDTFSSGVTKNGQVYDNTLEAQERPNLEYTAIGLEAVGMEVRVFATGVVQDVTFTDNTFSGQTGLGGDWAAAGARVSISAANTLMANSGLVFQGNTFQGVLNSVDPSVNVGLFTSSAWGLTLSQIPAGTGLEFLNNTFASNDISLNLGDDMGYETSISGVLFVGSTIAKLDQGVAMPYVGVAVGNWEVAVSGVELIDTSASGGATTALTFMGYEAKDVEVGWLLNLAVTNAIGSAVAGANVSLLNASGQQVYSGVTDANGDLAGIDVETTMNREVGGSPGKINPVTTTNYGPFTAVVNQGGEQQTFVIGTLSGNTNDTLELS